MPEYIAPFTEPSDRVQEVPEAGLARELWTTEHRSNRVAHCRIHFYLSKPGTTTSHPLHARASDFKSLAGLLADK